MRVVPPLLLLACALALAACSKNIGDINLRPDRYYQQTVRFMGQVSRLEKLSSVTLLEVVSQRGSRILVKSEKPVDAESGDWVSVKGLLVPEARVGDAVLYDVVVAEDVSRRGPPRIPDFM
jgi:starvation-inducible outer membrane lipoprotein